MSQPSRHFCLVATVPMSGVTLITRLGPLVESWNRRHDRRAGLCITHKVCDGVPVAPHDGYVRGNTWQIGMHMKGSLVDDDKVAEICALMLAAMSDVQEEQRPAHGVQA